MTPPRIILAGLGPQLGGLQWESDNLLRIGRQNTLEIVLNYASVNRRHAEVVATPKGWIVRETGNPTGTFLNGTPVDQVGVQLHLNDVIQCGSISLQVAVLEEGDIPSTAPVPKEDPNCIRTSSSFVRVQASAQRTWEQAVEHASLSDNQPQRQGKHFLTLLRAGHHLAHMASLNDLLKALLDDTVKVLEAQRGSIVLADELTGELSLRAVSAPKLQVRSGRCFSKTLAQRCFTHGESLLCRDAKADIELERAGSIAHGAMSSIICAVLRSPRKRLGVLHLDRGPLQEPFTQDDLDLTDAIAANVAVGIESAQLVEQQRELFLQTVTALARAVEARDQYTGSHTQRVTAYSLLLAQELRLSPEDIHRIQVGTPLHDIGKIAIHDSILRKPGPLTAEEFEYMKLHTVKGAAILESIPGLTPMIPIVRNHHERWDGKGYPDRLAGANTCRLARVVAVADAFDAMTSDRPYRPALSAEEAFLELEEKSGSHFDPECARAFLRVRPRVQAMLAEETPVPAFLEPLSSGVLHREAMAVLRPAGSILTSVLS